MMKKYGPEGFQRVDEIGDVMVPARIRVVGVFCYHPLVSEGTDPNIVSDAF